MVKLLGFVDQAPSPLHPHSLLFLFLLPNNLAKTRVLFLVYVLHGNRLWPVGYGVLPPMLYYYVHSKIKPELFTSIPRISTTVLNKEKMQT